MKQIPLFLNTWILRLTKWVGMFFFLFFFLLSISVTSEITWTTDFAPYHYADFPILHLAFLPFLIWFLGTHKIELKSEKMQKRLQTAVLVFFLVSTVVYYGYVYADPMYCLTSARELAGVPVPEADKTLAHYIHLYPIQSFYVWYLSIYVKLFGSFDVIAYKLASICLYSISLVEVRQLLKSWMKEDYSVLADLCLVLFLPGWMVSEFGYNDVHSFFFVISGIYLYETKAKEKKWIFPASALLMAIGCGMRSNHLILLIAYGVVLLFKTSFLQILLLYGCFFAFYKGIGWNSYEMILSKFPEIADKTLQYPLSSWISIGLNTSDTGAGWWAPDVAVPDASASESLKETVSYWLCHPLEFLVFEIRKYANGYTMPDFETFDSYRHKGSLWRNSLALKSFLYDRNIWYQIIFFIFNIGQSLFYAGNFLYLYLKKEKTRAGCFGIIFFIGTALFHSFWEIKSRYLVMSIVLAVPTAAAGLILAAKYFKKEHIKKYLCLVPVILILSIILQGILFTDANAEKLSQLQTQMQWLWDGGY